MYVSMQEWPAGLVHGLIKYNQYSHMQGPPYKENMLIMCHVMSVLLDVAQSIVQNDNKHEQRHTTCFVSSILIVNASCVMVHQRCTGPLTQ